MGGLSKNDYEEKLAWQASRKKQRTAAVERMKQNDRFKEEERLEMERLKREAPEEYKQRLAEQEFEFRRNEEDRKRQRQRAAALERQRREEAGLPPEEDVIEEEKMEKRRARARQKRAAKKESWLKENWLMLVLGGLFCMFIVMNLINMCSKDKED